MEQMWKQYLTCSRARETSSERTAHRIFHMHCLGTPGQYFAHILPLRESILLFIAGTDKKLHDFWVHSVFLQAVWTAKRRPGEDRLFEHLTQTISAPDEHR